MSNSRTSIKLTIEQRKMILQLMNYSYKIPEEYQDCVVDAIKRYATRQYTEEKIREMVQKSQSIANSGYLLREDSISLFRGKFAEWLACIEYNAMKNSGAVIMTIVNPDEYSKADLLHFIKVGDEFRAVAGPDIKTGGSTYVFNQWKKVVTSRHDIPMVDFDGILTTENGLKQLTNREREEFELLCEKFPKKRPVPSAWGNQDELRLRADYFKDLLKIKGTFTYTPEIANLLKTALANQSTNEMPQLDWSDFNKKCKEIFKDFNPMPEIASGGSRLKEFSQPRERMVQDPPKYDDPGTKHMKANDKIPSDTMCNNINIFRNNNNSQTRANENIPSDTMRINIFGNNNNSLDAMCLTIPGKDSNNPLRDRTALDFRRNNKEPAKHPGQSPGLTHNEQNAKAVNDKSNSGSTDSPSQGSPKSPHNRKGHERKLSDGRVINVKATRVNKDKGL